MTSSLIKFTTLQWLDTPIDTIVTWIYCSVQINDTCQQEHAVAAARHVVQIILPAFKQQLTA